MGSRGHVPPAYGVRSVPAPGMMRHGSFPVGRHMESLPPPEHPEHKLAAQAAEIERLTGDNRRLAATHVALRQDLIAAQQEMQKLRSHIGSIQAESDKQVRALLDKIGIMDADIRAGESLKKELQQAHMEARSLVVARQELTAQIERATQELEKVRADVKKLPEMHAELDSLRQGHQMLRKTFEYEKGLNMEKVEQMQLMEKDLVAMARDVEKLRAEVLNAGKRANAPDAYGGPYMTPDLQYPPPPPPPSAHVTGGYVDAYGRPLAVGTPGEGMIPYHTTYNRAAHDGNPAWGGEYDGPRTHH